MAEAFGIPEVSSIKPAQLSPVELRAPRLTPSIESKSFGEVLAGAVGEVQRLQIEADTTIKQLVSGEITDVAEAMVAVERADVSFQTMMAVRNKMVAAYEEVMRMQV